jgi:glutaminase
MNIASLALLLYIPRYPLFPALPASVGIVTPIERYLQELHARYLPCQEGRVADYIPELTRADPNWFGICIATRDGHIYEIGDSQQSFTIQSISKALVYGLALEDRGEPHVRSRIGVEPSGDAFNAISLQPGSGRPFNPMINAGAIAATGQVLARDGKSRIERVVSYLSGCAGRPLGIDQDVYRSESETGHRNRAIGWMLRNFNIIDEEPTDILETYFQQCAIQVTCRDLAVIGATLANQGVNPVTRKQAIAPEYVGNILALMTSCGMYDYSGEWISRVGLPAKSGVGGGILAVLPGQLGIGIFSPPLDAQGNSARGIHVCTDLSRDMALHLFHSGAAPQSALRLSYNNTQVSSRQRRPQEHKEVLQTEGARIRMLELQGELIFSTVEPIIRTIQKQSEACQYFVLNFRNVINADQVSLQLIADLQSTLDERGIGLLLCHVGKLAIRLLRIGLNAETLFANDDFALEECENRLLTSVMGDLWRIRPAITLAQCELLEGLGAEDMAWLDARLGTATYAEGEAILRTGGPGDGLYLLIGGSVEVQLPRSASQPGKRLEVLTAGMSFGEMAIIDRAPRSADVIALEPVTCRVLDIELFNQLDTGRPDLKIGILNGITRRLSSNLRRANREAQVYRA